MIRFLLLSFFLFTTIGCQSETKPDVFDPTSSPYFLDIDKRVDINGLKIRYREEGALNAQPLVIIHGFTSSLESWDDLARDLSTDYRVIRLDLPGHGLTGPDLQGRYSNSDTVAFLAGFLDALDIEKPVIIGNSLGGLVAWRYAAQHPDNVKGLTLIAPGGFSINGVTDEPVAVPMMVKIYLTKAPEAGVKQALKALYGHPDTLSEARITSFRDLMQVPGNGEAFVARAGAFTLPDPTDTLKNLDVPALILWGEKDVMVPVAHGAQFSELMPDSNLITYSDAGHVPQEEIPDQVAIDIRKFLESL